MHLCQCRCVGVGGLTCACACLGSTRTLCFACVVEVDHIVLHPCLRTRRHHREAVSCCAWMPDSKSFLSGSVDKTIIMSDTKGGWLLLCVGSKRGPQAIRREGSSGCRERGFTRWDV